METNKLDDFTITTSGSIREAMVKITANKHRVVVVLDGKKVVGTVSDGDIRRALLRGVLSIAPVNNIMNVNCIVSQERDPEKLAEIIRKERVTVLPVVDQSSVLVDIFLAYEPLI
ncbi:MAG: CBS domain-containing protein [SAR202 cluster bacterium]|nr:CBS domain-containing protein [SAR202 cluster bacterium]